MYLKIQDLLEINRISLKFIRLKLLLIKQVLYYVDADAILDQINKQTKKERKFKINIKTFKFFLFTFLKRSFNLMNFNEILLFVM